MYVHIPKYCFPNVLSLNEYTYKNRISADRCAEHGLWQFGAASRYLLTAHHQRPRKNEQQQKTRLNWNQKLIVSYRLKLLCVRVYTNRRRLPCRAGYSLRKKKFRNTYSIQLILYFCSYEFMCSELRGTHWSHIHFCTCIVLLNSMN